MNEVGILCKDSISKRVTSRPIDATGKQYLNDMAHAFIYPNIFRSRLTASSSHNLLFHRASNCQSLHSNRALLAYSMGSLRDRRNVSSLKDGGCDV